MNYLYNGVELPALPEWDRERYPYAVIERGLAGHVLLCFNSRPYYDGSAVRVDNTSYVQFQTFGGNEWHYNSTNNFQYPEFDLTYFVWTETDILNPDGSVYLAASDPVPVSVLSIDYTAMVQGWIVGKRLAAQRGKKLPGDITDATFENGILYIKNASAVLNGSILEVK